MLVRVMRSMRQRVYTLRRTGGLVANY